MKGKNISNKFSKIKENLKNNKSLIYKIVIFICILSGTFQIGFTLIIWKTFLHTDQTPQLTYNLFLTIGTGVLNTRGFFTENAFCITCTQSFFDACFRLMKRAAMGISVATSTTRRSP